jgi:hypothetical protein
LTVLPDDDAVRGSITTAANGGVVPGVTDTPKTEDNRNAEN